MQEQIEKVAETFETGQFENLDDEAHFSPLIQSASKIAHVSLILFTGDLLQKGLDIAKAIAEFDAELSISDHGDDHGSAD